MSVLQSSLGIVVFVLLMFLLSKNKKNIQFKYVIVGLLTQFVLAGVLLNLPIVTDVLMGMNEVVAVLKNSTDRASRFMFGYLSGEPYPFDVKNSDHTFIVAFQVLPLVIVISALSGLLFHFGILNKLILAFSFLLKKTFNISGVLGFGAASTVFFGTIEAPLLIKPYLSKLTQSELFRLIVCSMSTISGTVIVLYATVLESILPNPIMHLITASLISLPAALMLSYILMPEAVIDAKSRMIAYKTKKSWIESLLDSTQDGVKMAVSIAAIIIVLFAFIHMLNAFLGIFSSELSINYIVQNLLRPFMWLVGFNWEQSSQAAQIMGMKIVLNEFVAYLELSKLNVFSPSQLLVLVYSLCGFANIASCGIIIAGLSAILPSRRAEIVSSTFKALFVGNIATLMTGAVISINLFLFA